MLSYTQVKDIAENLINVHAHRSNVDLVIVDRAIVELPYAWIFPYSSKRWLEGDFDYAVAGNSPLFVDKSDGRVSTFRTGLSIEGMIDEYEEQNKTWSLTISSDVYSDTQKLLSLKRHFRLTQETINEWKRLRVETIAAGGKRRLEKLASMIKSSGINCTVVLDSKHEGR